MSGVIEELEGRLAPGGHADGEAIERFLNDNSFPIVEGRSVTFAWRGRASEVHLRHWIYGLPSSAPFRNLPGTDLWVLVFELPERSRMEYKLEIVRGHQRQLVTDPLNEHYAKDPYGANSVVHATDYDPPDWALESETTRPGTIEELTIFSDVFEGPRPVQIYVPARYRATRRYPLLVVHDGQDYVRFADLKIVLDNLIHRLEIPSMIVALTQSPNRLHEYAHESSHAKFLTEELVPLVEERYSCVGQPAARGLLGASFGAVASLSTAWLHPGFFGKLCLQSGSFAFTDIGDHDRGPLFDSVVEFVNEFREAPGRPAEQVYVSCGTYESLIYYNRSLVPLLQETGMRVRYVESRDGHNWENWRDRLREALSWLFPGPLWMVYE